MGQSVQFSPGIQVKKNIDECQEDINLPEANNT